VKVGDAYQLKPPRESDGQSFQFIDFDCAEIISTLLVRNTSTDSYLSISILEETERYALVELWEEGRSFGILPILKDEEINRLIKNEPIETTAGFIWQWHQDSQSGMGLLNSKRINCLERYSSTLNQIAMVASRVMAHRVAEIYLFLARKENRDTAGLDEWKKSKRIPEWLDRVEKVLHLLILREFDTYPEEAETLRRDYWRSIVSIALQDMRKQGITNGVTGKELRVILNRHIFDNDEFDGSYEATVFCARALVAKEMIRSNVLEKSVEEWNQILGIGKQPTTDLRCKPSHFVFEREPILPFVVVEEKIRMTWQNPAGSDLEILNGGVRSDLCLSSQEWHEQVTDTIKIWQKRKSIWQEAREKLDNPQHCLSFYRWVISERRRVRRYMRSRYGFDMARGRVLRKSIAPRTAKDTALRAIWYAEAMALEAAAEAGHFTLVWHKEEMEETGHEFLAACVKAVKEAAKASLGVLEAFPLFHLAIFNRTNNPAIRAAETYFLCGIGADISWRKFRSLYKTLSTQDGVRLSGKDTYKQFIDRLPGAVLDALEGRQIGDRWLMGGIHLGIECHSL
jgi:hypothetical protein